MREWLVELVGAGRDLRFLAETLRKPDCRVTEDDGKFHLRSSRFASMVGANDVKEEADKMIGEASLAASLRFDRFEGVSTGTIECLRADGSRDVSVYLMCGALIVDGCDAMVATAKPQVPDLAPDMGILRQRKFLGEALRHLQAEPNWSGYWKAAEAFGQDIGGGPENVVKLGWATKAQWDRFYHTVHHHRHRNKPLPENPMDEHEARSFIRGLLARCRDWNREGRPWP